MVSPDELRRLDELTKEAKRKNPRASRSRVIGAMIMNLASPIERKRHECKDLTMRMNSALAELRSMEEQEAKK